MALWTVWANYAAEERVWYAMQSDIPGLFIDAETIEEFARKAGEHLPDLLEIHADEFGDKSQLEGPHRIRIVAFHEREFAVAA
ncbi:MAG TPA: DUF1902 domain-containing protein [Allosphingosinicella sp.]